MVKVVLEEKRKFQTVRNELNSVIGRVLHPEGIVVPPPRHFGIHTLYGAYDCTIWKPYGYVGSEDNEDPNKFEFAKRGGLGRLLGTTFSLQHIATVKGSPIYDEQELYDIEIKINGDEFLPQIGRFAKEYESTFGKNVSIFLE